MSTANTIMPMQTPLIVRRTRAYYAPVNRVTGAPTIFDPALQSAWSDAAPASPWVDLGWISDFARSAESVIAEVDSGMPAQHRSMRSAAPDRRSSARPSPG
jgi:hypothetical protein